MEWDVHALPAGRATRGDCRECLALREQAATEEGDAFLAPLRCPDATHPVGRWPVERVLARNASPLWSQVKENRKLSNLLNE